MARKNTRGTATADVSAAPQTRPDAPTAANGAAPGTGTAARPDGAAAGVWDALTANPGGTVADIAAAAGVSKATARKALISLENDGHAARTPGAREHGKRTGDTWAPAIPAGDPGTDPAANPGTGAAETATTTDTRPQPSDPAAEAAGDAPAAREATASAESASTESASTESASTESASTESASAETDTAEDTADDAADEEGMDEEAVAEACQALEALSEVIGSAITRLQAGDRETALTAAELIYTGSGKTRRLVRAAARRRPRNGSGQARSHPGELRDKVAAHLAAHPGGEFTPHQIGRVIGHSAGAIANALDRLIARGEAVETCERPRRFAAAGTPTPAADGRDEQDAATA